MYLNLQVPKLQYPAGSAHFLIKHRGRRFASSALMYPMSKKLVTSIESFAQREGIELVTVSPGQRKEDVAEKYLKAFEGEEGVRFIGKAQEKSMTMRTQRRYNAQTGAPCPHLFKRTSMVNQSYFYAVDKDFGPFFIKFSSYLPYNGKLRAGPTSQWAGVFRADYRRQPRPRASRPYRTDLRPARHTTYFRTFPQPCDHPRRHSLAALRLQAQSHQAVPQGGPSTTNRDHDQQQPRLRDRQATAQPLRTPEGRLRSQSATGERPRDQSRLHARRRSVPEHPSTHGRRRPARKCVAFR